MPNNSNLTPFKSGDQWKGNAKGRPKGSMTTNKILHRWMMAKEVVKPDIIPLLKKEQRLTQLDIIILKQIEKARKGDTAAAEFLVNRYAGKPIPVLRDEDGNEKLPTVITVEIV